jgi:hypothetical protein
MGWGGGWVAVAELWTVSRPLSERRGPPPFFWSRFLFIPKHRHFPMFRGIWYMICHLIGETLWDEVLVTTGTLLYCINGRKLFTFEIELYHFIIFTILLFPFYIRTFYIITSAGRNNPLVMTVVARLNNQDHNHTDLSCSMGSSICRRRLNDTGCKWD